MFDWSLFRPSENVEDRRGEMMQRQNFPSWAMDNLGTLVPSRAPKPTASPEAFGLGLPDWLNKQDGSMPAQAVHLTGQGPSDKLMSGVTRMESGGNFNAIGNITKDGDRAYGFSQVMGKNVGPWTEKYYGKRLTPEEYLNNPEAQKAVTNGELGRLEAKYGPEGAARAWFAGEGGMNNLNARDVNGMTVARYGAGVMGGSPSPVAAAMQPQPQMEAPAALSADAIGGGRGILDTIRDYNVGDRMMLAGAMLRDNPSAIAPATAAFGTGGKQAQLIQDKAGNWLAYDKKTGQLKPVLGSGYATEAEREAATAAAKKKGELDAQREAEKPAAVGQAQLADSQMAQLGDLATKLANAPLEQATGWRGLFPSAPGGTARTIDKDFETLKTQIGFSALQTMRDMSKTGGALGQIAIKEGEWLQQSLQNLDQLQDPQVIRQRLTEIANWAARNRARINETLAQTYPDLRKERPPLESFRQ